MARKYCSLMNLLMDLIQTRNIKFSELIKNLSKDKIVIISTHILEEMTAVGNRVRNIAKGKILFDDSPKALNRQSKYYGAVSLHFYLSCI
jgi:ABC-type multidrug transport system ATPase subunit